MVGCKLIGFAETESPDRLRIVTLEELSAYRGLKQRLQLATRDLVVQESLLDVAAVNTQPISATSRGPETVRSIAAMNQVQGRTEIAIAYQALDVEGRDKIVLESLIGNAQGKFTGDAVELRQYPSAMHVGPTGQLYCGYADGRVSQYVIGGLTRKPDTLQQRT